MPAYELACLLFMMVLLPICPHAQLAQVSDVDEVPQTNVENPSGVAVVIGIEEYSMSSIPPVDFAERDAVANREYPVKALG